MIVPEKRLIAWSAVVLLACGIAVRWFPYACAAVLLGGVLVLIIDAVQGAKPLPRLQLTLPPLVRLTKSRPGQVDIRVSNLGDVGVEVRVGVVWPEGILAPGLPGSAGAPRDAGEAGLMLFALAPRSTSSFSWPCVALRRGQYRLSDYVLVVLSPFKLWSVLSRRTTECEVRVYPDLMRERKTTASMLLRGTAGTHLQRQVGQGREFEKLREYVPGDSYSEIHWKATAKRGRPITKAFQVEKTQEIYVVIDNSRLSGRYLGLAPNGDEDHSEMTALEYFISAGLLVGIAAERYGDLFGLLVYSDRVLKFVRAGGGKQHFNACRQALYDLRTRPVPPDLQELSSFIGGRLRRRALLVFLTDFEDPVTTESFLRNIELVARRHLVLVNTVRPRETGRIFAHHEVDSVADIYRALAGHLEWQKLMELQRTLFRMGVRMDVFEPERLAGSLISQYLTVKQRQLL
ncbi:MAG: DUF58 domain-containing protein [Acidobacteria bacterium]|nr:MAG: DUF58 domain-containing protein [Acidobacteriota bacterium]